VHVRRMRRSRRRLHEVKCAEKNIAHGSNFFSYKGLICHKLGAMKSMFDISYTMATNYVYFHTL